MGNQKTDISRRRFMKTAGVTGLGSALLNVNSPSLADSGSSESTTGKVTVPLRPFGDTGIDVSILSLGGVLKPSDQLIFRQAFKMGVTYWDTADSYGWGKNEKAIGEYLAKFPDDRKAIFLVTKAASNDPGELTEKLQRSLSRMNTTYVDMFFIHYVKNVKTKLTREVKAWADRQKRGGKIRLFGFSTHKNMADTMLAAAKLGWVDGIMMSYNYRLMGKDKMKQAVEACVKAGIGLTAMKTQAAFSANFYASVGSETDDALKMTEHFLKKGFTAEQAKLKAVWENPHIASICSAMPNMTILQANVAAALSNQPLTQGDRKRLETFARQTKPGYCAGCGQICESQIAEAVPICDIMRLAMYQNSYSDRNSASRLFRAIPADVKKRLLSTDYRPAEKVCPHRMAIGKIIKDTYLTLA